MTDLDPAIRAYYDRGDEADRLAGPSLERVRTQELIERYLPAGELEVLDVGGGAGVYAGWLATKGHGVSLVDPVPLHVEQARTAHPDVKVSIGDARALDFEAGAFDVVLMLGPLYHLPSRDERIDALGEAMRVLRPGGLLFVAAINRFAALLDLLVNLDRAHEEDVWRLIEESVGTGAFRGPGEAGLFTTGYFHLPAELAEEIGEAGLQAVEVFNIEGPGYLIQDIEKRWADPARREAMLKAARLVESEPAMLGAGSHLLAVGRRPRWATMRWASE
jgi:SAM-dependent methyltransferase